MDWRLTRAQARQQLLERDAQLRARMPIFRDRPPLSEEQIAAELPFESAHHAFWRDLQTPRPLEEALAGASRAQIVGFCVQISHADICNGGFHQYFSNSTGNYAMVTIDALRWLGDDTRADLMTRAMSRFPNGVAPTKRAERHAVLARIDYKSDWKTWIRPIEDAYFALDEKELGKRIRSYVTSHLEELFLDD